MTTEERPAEEAAIVPPHAQVPPPPPMSPFVEIQQQATRPISPRVIAVLFFLGALVDIGGLDDSKHHGASLHLLSIIICVVFAIALTGVGIGLVQYRSWAPRWAVITLIARFVMMLVYAILAIGKVRMLVPPELGPNFIPIVLAITFSVILLYFGTLIFFLTRPTVKAACDR